MASGLDLFATITQADLIDRMLASTDDTFDKREGSVIYDAISSVGVVIYDLLHDYFPRVYNAARLTTATGDDLDDWAAAFGLTRDAATYTYWKLSITNENGVVGDMEVGERLVAHDDDSIWYYVGSSIAVSAELGEQDIFGIAEPDNEYENITRVEFTTVSQEGHDEESDASLRRRIMRELQGAKGGNMNDYADLILHQFPIDHPEIRPFTGVFIFPVQRRAGYVQILPYWDNESANTELKNLPSYQVYKEARKTLKEYLDPTNTEGYGNGKVPIGHRVLMKRVRPSGHMQFKIWINDGTYPTTDATASETEEIRAILQRYIQQQTNAAAYTKDGNVPSRRSNNYNIELRTANMIVALEEYKNRHPGVQSFQMSIRQNGQWVETSDDYLDVVLSNSSARVRLPTIDPGHIFVYHGKRELS